MSASDPTNGPVAQPAAEGRPGWAWRPFALALPALVLLVAVIGYPLFTIVLRSLSEPEWGLQNYAWFFGAPVNLTQALPLSIACRPGLPTVSGSRFTRMTSV